MFGSIKYDKLGKRKRPLYVYFVNANGNTSCIGAIHTGHIKAT